MRPIASKRENKSPAKIQKLHKGPKINQLYQDLVNRWKNVISKAQIKSITEAFDSVCWANDLIAILNAVIPY
jgi:hypothetical protein